MANDARVAQRKAENYAKAAKRAHKKMETLAQVHGGGKRNCNFLSSCCLISKSNILYAFVKGEFGFNTNQVCAV